jgi:hypothetical protein
VERAWGSDGLDALTNLVDEGLPDSGAGAGPC